MMDEKYYFKAMDFGFCATFLMAPRNNFLYRCLGKLE
jgi:hypothetical protein